MLGLDLFDRQFVPQWRIFHAIFKQECIATGGQPVQAGGSRQGAGVAMVAQPRPDLFDAGPDVTGIGGAGARQGDQVNIQGMRVDQISK